MEDSQQKSKRIAAVEVLALKYWAPALLSFTTTKPVGFTFTAGQYSRLALNVDGQMIWRAFSIVSAPHEDVLEYVGVLIPGGLFTGKLAQIQAGETLWMECENYGFMTPDRFADGEDLWMLATGTGLGPFISILRDGLVWTQFRHLFVVHGVKHESELAYQAELIDLQARSTRDATQSATLQLIQCVTRGYGSMAASTLPRLRTRITTALENGTLEDAAHCQIRPATSRIMLCGNPAMIEQARGLLHQRGMKPCRRTLPGQFLTENYW